jgi:hypothetical protein
MLLYFNFNKGKPMATTTPVSQQTPIPALPRLVNSASSVLVKLFWDKALPYPISGAALGYFHEKTITFALCSTMQGLIWNYLTPYTIDALFRNKYSNSSSKVIGDALTYATGILGSYYLTKNLTERIAQHFPSAVKIAEENKKPFLKRHAVYLSLAPLASYASLLAVSTATYATLSVAIALCFNKKS